MTGLRIDERTLAISELTGVADHFAEQAQRQELSRDRSRPGTGLQHQHAHSATLWRLAERTLRSRIDELMAGDDGGPLAGTGDPGATQGTAAA